MRLVTPGVFAGTGLVLSLAAIGLSDGLAVHAAAPAIAGAIAGAVPDPLPGAGMRTAAVRHYRMDGRIRPLLFWFGKNDIGMARITWRAADDGGRGYEMLVGTDPARAPRALNKWGFISEQVSGPDGRLLALMTGQETASYDEAAADAAHAERTHAGGDFRAIVGSVNGGAAAWRTTRINTASNFSIHDVDAALDRIRQDAAGAAASEQPLAPGTRPGFLVALAEFVDRGAGQLPGSAAARGARQQRIRYAFGQGSYELALRGSELATIELDGRAHQAVRASFEIRTLATDARTRFDVLFGVEPGLANVPVAAEWQPRWWLKVELRLVNAAS